MARDINRNLPDGDTDYDGEEEEGDEYIEDAYQRDWEISTLSW